MIEQFLDQVSVQRDRLIRLSKEGGWIVAGQIATVLGSLVLVRVLTEYLEPTEYGKLALGLTIGGLVNQVIMGGITNGIGRFYSIALEWGDLWGYLQATRRLLGYATMAVLAIGAAIGFGLMAANQSQWLGLATAVLAFSILSGCNSSLSSIQNAARQRAIVALHSGMDAWLKIAMVIGVMLWLGCSSTAAVVGYALSIFVVTASQLFFLKRLMNRQGVTRGTRSNANWLSQIWQFSWPFSVWGIFTWAQQVSDRWALEGFASTHEVGQYVVVFQLGYAPIGIVTGLMVTMIGPILYLRIGGATDDERNLSVHRLSWRIAQLSIAVTAGAFFFAWLLHDWLFRWLVAESFRGVSYFLPWVVLAGGLFAAGQTLSLKLMAEIRSRSLLQVKVGTAVFGVVANGVGAWWCGISGVVAALVMFSAVYVIWVMFLAAHMPTNPSAIT